MNHTYKLSQMTIVKKVNQYFTCYRSIIRDINYHYAPLSLFEFENNNINNKNI